MEPKLTDEEMVELIADLGYIRDYAQAVLNYINKGKTVESNAVPCIQTALKEIRTAFCSFSK